MNAFVHEARGAMTPKRRASVFLACNGLCHVCTRKIMPGDDYEIDHIIALECGGSDEDTNPAPVCEWCHKPKTAADHGRAAKGKRIAVKHAVPSRFKPKNAWSRR